MREAIAAAAALLALCGQAQAADLGIPIDVFAVEFNARAKAMAVPVTAADPVVSEEVWTTCLRDKCQGGRARGGWR